MFISAIPSLALSLQPNTERVKGKFIPFVISRALPGALTMGLSIFAIYIIGQIPSLVSHFSFSSDPSLASSDPLAQKYHTLLILSLTITGLVMLFRICQPYNVWRMVIFLTAIGLCIFVVSIPPLMHTFIFEHWYSVKDLLEIQHILLLIILAQTALPMSGGLIKFFDMFNRVD